MYCIKGMPGGIPLMYQLFTTKNMTHVGVNTEKID